MTPDAASEITSETIKQPPSTAGMTTKVVKGSLWTLAGQVAPLAVSIITTPFVIRMLGAESYGVLILIALIPTYLGFADFGMSMASTKFASEAYSEGDEEKEARIVRTAAFIALCTSIPIAALLILFAGKLVTLFNVPQPLLPEATLALRIASVTFVVNILCTIVNSPQLARLRMDLNTLVNAGSRIIGLIATPLVIYLGYGVIGSVTVLLIASIINLLGHVIISSRFANFFRGQSIERDITKRMLRFGGSLVIAGAAAVLVVNMEKVILPSQINVEALAYYSVAFTLASMVALFSQAMIQSLIPAFSQLQGPENAEHLNALFARGLRLSFIIMLPVISTLAVVAKIFFLLWAGPDFAEQSLIPFYVLLAGLFFNIPAYLPYATIMATGRSDVFAKLYLIELVPYLFLVFLLTSKFGIVGAAAAWSIRTFADAILQFVLAKRLSPLKLDWIRITPFLLAFLIVSIPVVATALFGSFSIFNVVILFSCISLYLYFVVKRLFESAEVELLDRLLRGRVKPILKRI